MIWAKIRLCLNKEGHYMDTQIGVYAQDIPEGANLVAALCQGYMIASGFKAAIHEVRGMKDDSGEYFIMPNDIDKLQLRLLHLKASI